MNRDDFSPKRRRRSNPTKASFVLNKQLDKLGLSGALSRRQLIQKWPNIVSKTISAHSRAEKVVGSVLYILVDSSVWMNELSANKAVLLQKINARLPGGAPRIEDVRFRQCSWAKEISQPAKAEAPEIKPTPAELNKRKLILEAVKDPDLRLIFESLLDKDYKLKKTRESSD